MNIPTLADIVNNPDAFTADAKLNSIILDLFNAPAPTTTPTYREAFEDPNGNVTPINPNVTALYFPLPPLTEALWVWSVTNQNWFQPVAP